MPTYEFRCPNGHEFERFYRKISDGQATAECPECHEMAERRMSAGAGLLFKGSGFYITDYGKDGKKDQRDKAKAASDAASSSGSSAGSGESSSGGSSKSESAPAAKPEKAAEKPAAAPKKASNE